MRASQVGSVFNFPAYEQVEIMDIHAEQPDVRRRLNFDDIDMRDDGSVPREGGERNTALPGDAGVPTPAVITDSEATDTEVSSGEEEGDEVPGLRVLYQGYGRPLRLNVPHRGFVTMFIRGLDGFTQVLSLPIGRVQLALQDDEELPEGNHQ